MIITRLTATEFEFECEGDEEAREAKETKTFTHEGATYLVKRITPGVDTGSYRSFFVVVK